MTSPLESRARSTSFSEMIGGQLVLPGEDVSFLIGEQHNKIRHKVSSFMILLLTL